MYSSDLKWGLKQYRTGKKKVERGLSKARKTIRKHPFSAAGIASGTGLAAGGLGTYALSGDKKKAASIEERADAFEMGALLCFKQAGASEEEAVQLLEVLREAL